MSAFRVAATLIVVTVMGLPTAPGQEPDPLQALQAKNVITDEDRSVVQAWVAQRVSGVMSKDTSEAGPAVRELRAGFSGTQSFKDTYAAVCIEAVGSAYKRAERVPAARLLTTLIALNETGANRVFVEALGDKRAAIRQAGAVGLRNLRSKLLAGGGTLVTDALAALVAAGKKETSTVPLRTIYQALDYTGAGMTPTDPKPIVAAVLELLEARAAQYAAGKVKAEGADAEGLRVAGALRAAMTEEQRRRYIVAVAGMLRYAIIRYTSGEPPLHKVIDKNASTRLIELRNGTEFLIDAGERELIALLAPPDPPTVAQKMKTEGLGAPTAMKIQWENNWVPLLENAVGQSFRIDPTAKTDGG